MAAPTKKIFAVGLNAARIYKLDQDTGWMDASNATAYDGFSVGGPVTFTYEPPDPEVISHPGNNQVLQQDSLPSLEASSGTLEVSRTDVDTIAHLTNIKVNTTLLTNVNSIGWRTNQQGTEPTVAFVTYAQAKTPAGVRCWSTYCFAKSVITPKPKGQSREQQNQSYFVLPQFATSHLVGVAYSSADDGFTSTEVNEYQSNYRLHLAAWKTTSTETLYPFNALLKYTDNAGGGIVVTKNGVKMTYGATADAVHYVADADGITFGAALTNGDIVMAMYELADSAIDVD
jgi:hypothetical protein